MKTLQTRREIELEILKRLSRKVVKDAIKALTLYVNNKLYGKGNKTKSGAFSNARFGMKPLHFFIGECIIKLWNPTGNCSWKFEEKTLLQELISIADSTWTNEIKSYCSHKDDELCYDERDVEEIYDLDAIMLKEEKPNEAMNAKLYEIALAVSKDDVTFYDFTLLYFERESFNSIANTLGLTINQVESMERKLIRRLKAHKEEILNAEGISQYHEEDEKL
jgi:hypothetical protein